MGKTDCSDKESLQRSHLFAVHLYVSNVVLKHGGDVDLRELVLAEDNQKAGLPTSSIPHYYQLLTDGCHPWRETQKEEEIEVMIKELQEKHDIQ